MNIFLQLGVLMMMMTYEEVWKTWWWCAWKKVEDLKECFDSRDTLKT